MNVHSYLARGSNDYFRTFNRAKLFTREGRGEVMNINPKIHTIMKRILTLLITAICTVGLWAEKFAIGELTFRTISDTEVELYHAKYDITSVHLGATITYQGKTYRLTSIGFSAFKGCKSLTSITIPNSVTSIGDGAFAICSRLTSISIPNTVKSIGYGAFGGCSSLTSITIPNSVTSIGDAAFDHCSGLTSITIPNSVTSIGEGAFWDCSSLSSIIVEGGNTKFDSRDNCNAIIETATNTLIAGCQNTIIPNSVTSIGLGAFGGCSSLTSITIPNSVTSIGHGAFESCSGLTSITIPNSVTSMGDGAFYECYSLTSVAVPIHTEIDEDAFSSQTQIIRK